MSTTTSDISSALYATAIARAQQVAEEFDIDHQPDTSTGEMLLAEDTYLALDDDARISVTHAHFRHVRAWLDNLTLNDIRQQRAFAAKYERGIALMEIMVAHDCTMWEAERISRGEIDPPAGEEVVAPS